MGTEKGLERLLEWTPEASDPEEAKTFWKNTNELPEYGSLQCELCDTNIIWQFMIRKVSDLDNVKIVGNECILKFGVAVYDKDNKLLTEPKEIQKHLKALIRKKKKILEKQEKESEKSEELEEIDYDKIILKDFKPKQERGMLWGQKNPSETLGARRREAPQPQVSPRIQHFRQISEDAPGKEISTVQVIPPFYIFAGDEKCSRCGKETPVTCFGADGCSQDDVLYNKFILFYNIVDVPERLSNFFQEKRPYFKFYNAEEESMRHFVNHYIHCNARISDSYIIHHDDGCFYSLDKHYRFRKRKHILVKSKPFEITAKFHMS